MFRKRGRKSQVGFYSIFAVKTAATNSGSSPVAFKLVTTDVGSPLNGQFYVIGNPTDVGLGNSSGGGGGSTARRPIAPRTALTLTPSNSNTTNPLATASEHRSSLSASSINSHRLERRRATHNEVERRRRDTINTWIMQLGKLIPEVDLDDPDKGPPKGGGMSKGGILAKACDYVSDIRAENAKLTDKVSMFDMVSMENERLRSQLDEMKQENERLRQKLEDNGINPNLDSILSK